MRCSHAFRAVEADRPLKATADRCRNEDRALRIQGSAEKTQTLSIYIPTKTLPPDIDSSPHSDGEAQTCRKGG